ncbi:MAG: ABC transporter permease [Candidatus Moranbacteria bacterium]|nr:ABC transporter permease [Candidatus Moranbacteria bacterium]
MKLLKLFRAFTEGMRNFSRNKWLAFATVSVLTLALYVVSATVFLGLTGRMIVDKIEDNIDINVYLNPDVSEENALETKVLLESTMEVESVTYVSNDTALEKFLSDSSGDPSILEAVEEIGENPLLSYLIVHASDSRYYESIAQTLESERFKNQISHINYGKNKEKIERLNRITSSVERVGLIIGIIFVVISVLITFNTIRLSMYSRQKEFEVMRLVGASNMYVRMPSIFEGIFYGTISSFIAIVLIFVSAQSITPLMKGIATEGMLMGFYWQYFWLMLLGILVFGVFIGVVSSFIAIRRYLKI